MKNLIIVFVFWSVCLSNVSGQGAQLLHGKAPGIEWKKVTWVGQNLQQVDTGEDWWYSHKNVYENGIQIGVIACGFTSKVNSTHPSESTGCYLATALYDNCKQFRSPTNKTGENMQTMGLFNMKGEMQWCKSFQTGHFTNVIQSTDGNFIGVGITANTIRKGNVHPLGYNPTAANPSGDAFISLSCQNVQNVWHLNLTKVDKNGNIIMELSLWN